MDQVQRMIMNLVQSGPGKAATDQKSKIMDRGFWFSINWARDDDDRGRAFLWFCEKNCPTKFVGWSALIEEK